MSTSVHALKVAQSLNNDCIFYNFISNDLTCVSQAQDMQVGNCILYLEANQISLWVSTIRTKTLKYNIIANIYFQSEEFFIEFHAVRYILGLKCNTESNDNSIDQKTENGLLGMARKQKRILLEK